VDFEGLINQQTKRVLVAKLTAKNFADEQLLTTIAKSLMPESGETSISVIIGDMQFTWRSDPQ
jgi:hypothetical protein